MANISTTTDLVINKLSWVKYEQLCANGQLNPYELYITDDDRPNALSNEIQALSNQLSNYYEKSETSSSSQITEAIDSLSDSYQAKGQYLSVVPADYKTYGNTVSSLSNDGYATIDSVSKVFVKDSSVSAYEDGKQCDLSVIKLTNEEYAQLLSLSTIQPNALYVISSNYKDAYGQQIKNVDAPTISTDAANKGYVDGLVSSIEIPNDLSSFSNSPNYVKQDEINISYSSQTIWLSSKAYVTSVDCADFIKDGMLSSVELCSNQLIFNFNTDAEQNPISIALSNFIDETQYWKKSETSSASEISNALAILSNYMPEYQFISAGENSLVDHAIQHISLSSANTILVLPEIESNKVADFVVDVTNNYTVSNTPTAATISFSGTIGTNFNIVVENDDDFSDMTTFAPDELAQFYFTKTSFQLDGLLTWKISKQILKKYVLPVV